MKRVLCLLASLLCGAAWILPAQNGNGGLSKDVFYLMPDMAQGSVNFIGKAPATGKFNICAIDNTIRYKDKDGTELMVEIEKDMTAVTIGGTAFLCCSILLKIASDLSSHGGGGYHLPDKKNLLVPVMGALQQLGTAPVM